MLALMLVIEFLCAVELFATITVFGAIAMLLAIYLFDAETRSRIADLIAPTAAAYAISLAVLSPYLYFLFAGGIPHAPLWDPGRYSADLLNFVIPTTTAWIGAAPPVAAIATSFGGYIQETGAYLGIPLIVLAEDFRRRDWARPAGKFLILSLLILLVAALGPGLRIMGRDAGDAVGADAEAAAHLERAAGALLDLRRPGTGDHRRTLVRGRRAIGSDQIAGGARDRDLAVSQSTRVVLDESARVAGVFRRRRLSH